MAMTTAENGAGAAAAAVERASIVRLRDEALDSFRRGLEPADMDKCWQLAELLAKIGFCGVTEPAEALARIMQGRVLDVCAIIAMRVVYMVNGRPGLDAAFMHGRALAHHECEKFFCVQDTLESVTYLVKRRGQPEKPWTWTLADAERAGLAGQHAKKDSNWSKYPRQMLHARVKAEAARQVFPEAVFGMYSRDELSDGDIMPADVIDVSPVQAVPSPAPYEAAVAALKAQIAQASTADEKAACRDAIKRATDAGTIPNAYLQEAKDAYNAKFTKAKEKAAAEPAVAAAPAPAQTQERQPGED